MAKKYYAVSGGREGSAIYTTWAETKENIHGISKVRYKAFPSIEEAQAFISGAGREGEAVYQPPGVTPAVAKQTLVKPPGKPKPGPAKSADAKAGMEGQTDDPGTGELTAYVDGSFRQGYRLYGYGVVFIRDGEVLETLSGCGKKDKYVSMRNVAGEVLGAVKAIDWAVSRGYQVLHIHYDYDGIEKWATGKWKRNNELTQGYHEYFKARQSTLRVVFHKVTGHSGDKYNDMADGLAKKAIEDHQD